MGQCWVYRYIRQYFNISYCDYYDKIQHHYVSGGCWLYDMFCSLFFILFDLMIHALIYSCTPACMLTLTHLLAHTQMHAHSCLLAHTPTHTPCTPACTPTHACSMLGCWYTSACTLLACTHPHLLVCKLALTLMHVWSSVNLFRVREGRDKARTRSSGPCAMMNNRVKLAP